MGTAYVGLGVGADRRDIVCRVRVVAGGQTAMSANWGVISALVKDAGLAADSLGEMARVLPGEVSFLASCARRYVVDYLLLPRHLVFVS